MITSRPATFSRTRRFRTNSPTSRRSAVCSVPLFFFFNDTAPTEIYTLSLHDALPISSDRIAQELDRAEVPPLEPLDRLRSEEHTSELQSQFHLVCRLLLEKKNRH